MVIVVGGCDFCFGVWFDFGFDVFVVVFVVIV